MSGREPADTAARLTLSQRIVLGLAAGPRAVDESEVTGYPAGKDLAALRQRLLRGRDGR